MFARNAMQPLESWRRGRFGYALMTMLRRNSERRITRFITIIQEGMEFDFVIEDSRSGEVKVIEVKSGKDYKRHSALNNLMDSGAVKNAIILHDGNVSVDGDKSYLPIYATGLL